MSCLFALMTVVGGDGSGWEVRSKEMGKLLEGANCSPVNINFLQHYNVYLIMFENVAEGSNTWVIGEPSADSVRVAGVNPVVICAFVPCNIPKGQL